MKEYNRCFRTPEKETIVTQRYSEGSGGIFQVGISEEKGFIGAAYSVHYAIRTTGDIVIASRTVYIVRCRSDLREILISYEFRAEYLD